MQINWDTQKKLFSKLSVQTSHYSLILCDPPLTEGAELWDEM